MNWEITKQVLAAFVRWCLVGLGAWFVKRGIIDAQTADQWMTELTFAATGLVILAIPVIWKILNAKFNILALIAAVQTDPPVEVVRLRSESQAQLDTRTEIATTAAVKEVKKEVSDSSSLTLPY